MQIPAHRLDPKTLRALIVEFVTRDGTDYGEHEQDEATKVRRVEAQLASGEVVIVFDVESQTCNLLTREHARRLPTE